MPVISGLTFTKTDTTIAASWTTDVSSDSNLTCGSVLGKDNGLDGSVTSHSCIATGLSPSTTYSCVVTSGGTSSSPQNVTTNSPAARVMVQSASLSGSITYNAAGNGDTWFTFVSNDGSQYVTSCDGTGLASGTSQNLVLSKYTNVGTQAGSLVNGFTNFGLSNTYTGSDGPGGTSLTNKWGGCPFGLSGNLYCFLTRQNNNVSAGVLPPMYNGGILMSTDHGATWSNWQNPGTTSSNGVVPSPIGSFEYGSGSFGWGAPIRYAADDGTLGYNTSGNGIDGGNAFVYQVLQPTTTTINLMRVLRKALSTLTNMNFQYWIGPTSPAPADFVNDANWSSTPSGLTNIYSAPGGVGVVWAHITFLPTINSYVLTTDDVNYNWYFASAPTPAGPWTTFYNKLHNNIGGPCPLHSDVVANPAAGTFSMRITQSGNGSGGTTYAAGIQTIIWSTMSQLVSYGFTTVENPMSDGGNFSTSNSYTALQVPSSGKCEATATSTNALMYWSGAIPVGDTGGTWPADQYSEVTLGAQVFNGTDDTYTFVRQASAAHTLYLLVIPANTAGPGNQTATLYAIVAGTLHSLATFSITGQAGDVIRLSVTGNVLVTTQNNVVLNSFTDTNNFVTSGSPGLGVIASTLANTYLSNWAAGASQAPSPVFSPISGTPPVTVTLTSPSGGTVYYTTNGSTPTRSSSSVSSGGTVSVASSETLKAMSSATNFADSPVSSASFGGGNTWTQGFRKFIYKK